MSRALVKAAYLEWRVTKQCATGDGSYITHTDVPGWFWYAELGHGDKQGPSLECTLRYLTETNRKNLQIFRGGIMRKRRLRKCDLKHGKARVRKAKKMIAQGLLSWSE